LKFIIVQLVGNDLITLNDHAGK